jgi:hypothetical protein
MEKRFDIEEFVKTNIDMFNTDEPAEGHFERFQSKLGQGQERKIRPLIMRSLKYAAILIFVIGGVFTARYFDWFQKTEYQAENTNQEEDFKEVMMYYTMQLDEKQQELDKLTCKNTDNQKNVVNEDLTELKSSYHELTQELKSNPDNQQVKNAIITNFQTQIDVYNLVIKNLQNYC